MKPRIALLPSADLSYESGSVIQAKRLMRFLLAEGFDAWLLGSRSAPDFVDSAAAHVCVDPAVLDHPVIDDRPISDSELARSLDASIAFLDRLHAERPVDLVHAQYLSFTSLAAVLFKRRAGCRVVLSCFGRDLTIGIPHDRRLAEMARESLAGIDLAICPNTSVEQALLAFAADCDVRLSTLVIPPSLDPEVVVQIPLESTPARPSLVTINSCFTPEKGVDTTIAAFATVREHWPDAQLIIAGADDHPEQINRTRLNAAVRTYGLEGNVQFTGYVARRTVGSLLRACDLFVDARLIGNFSSVLLEAQFCGAATLASDLPSARHIINEGENGVLFEPGNVADLTRKMLGLLQERRYREALSRHCAAWVTREGNAYREEGAHARMAALYLELGTRP